MYWEQQTVNLKKCLVKHSVYSTYNLSKREASKLYGISRLKERASRVSEASRKIADIKSKHAYLACVEQRAFLQTLHLNPIEYMTQSSSESDSEFSDTDSSMDDDASYFEEADHVAVQSEECGTTQNTKNYSSGPAAQRTSSAENSEDSDISYDNVVNLEISPFVDIDIKIDLDMLQEASYNWFEFVTLIKQEFKDKGLEEELDQYLIDFLL